MYRVGVSRVWSEEEVFSFAASTALDWLFRAPFSKGCVKESRSCFSLTGSPFSLSCVQVRIAKLICVVDAVHSPTDGVKKYFSSFNVHLFCWALWAEFLHEQCYTNKVIIIV